MKLKLCCWMLCLLAPLASANSLCPSPLRVGFDNWPPYHYYAGMAAGQKELRGFAVEALTAMLKRLDCKASYVEMPWKRVLHGLSQGSVDIAMEAYFNEDRARYAWFSDAYNPGRSALWIRKSSSYLETDLASWLASGHTLGITKDYYYGAEISELLRRYAAQVSVVNDEQNYGKLVLGRIDGFLGDVLATPWGLKEEGLSDLIVPHTMAVYEAPTFFMFSKKRLSPEFVSAFNRELAEFKATNEYDIIWRRYAPASQ